MTEHVLYQQINKDHAFWSEKRRHGQRTGGHTAGLLTHVAGGTVLTNVLFDAGLGTIDGLCDLSHFEWQWPLEVFLTHAHADHHAELLILSEQWCTRGAQPRPAIPVRCTDATLDVVVPSHARGFRSGGTLAPVPLRPGHPCTVGIFSVTALAVDHFPGAVIYIVEFGRDKIIIGWDLKSLPSPVERLALQRPSLALLEANTWSAQSHRTGHTSVEEIVRSGFLRDLKVPEATGARHGAYFVHYSGYEDPEGPMGDQELALRFRREYPEYGQWVDVAARGQAWTFDIDRP